MENFNINGLICLRDVYKKKDIKNFINMVNNYFRFENIYRKIRLRNDYNGSDYYINNEYRLINSFNKALFYPKPVIDVRGNRDANVDKGMLDIFNVDKLFPTLNDIFNKDVILTIVNKLSNKNLKLQRINLHISNNVQNPSQFHFDQNGFIKYSIFLTDVSDAMAGPNVYIKKSHLKNNRKKISDEDIELIYGNIGDVLISYQTGYHKKLKQSSGNLTAYLVYNFTEIGQTK